MLSNLIEIKSAIAFYSLSLQEGVRFPLLPVPNYDSGVKTIPR